MSFTNINQAKMILESKGIRCCFNWKLSALAFDRTTKSEQYSVTFGTNGVTLYPIVNGKQSTKNGMVFDSMAELSTFLEMSNYENRFGKHVF
ncbi:hypothetical protein VmeM32_00026 [Vibrio phage vB_VmeM-32]|nr:hypothetical protein VmeM32_00026 [Vibrio phage vB_VmeM-32]